ncbi:hypothetical protein CU044_5244 [Streptomyces sp. L-9-10]|nr:hypothetical protein CU044_5244 [Streptomyces sp. L-9-10]
MIPAHRTAPGHRAGGRVRSAALVGARIAERRVPDTDHVGVRRPGRHQRGPQHRSHRGRPPSHSAGAAVSVPHALVHRTLFDQSRIHSAPSSQRRSATAGTRSGHTRGSTGPFPVNDVQSIRARTVEGPSQDVRDAQDVRDVAEEAAPGPAGTPQGPPTSAAQPRSPLSG